MTDFIVLGASGMLGYAIHKKLSDSGKNVVGIIRGDFTNDSNDLKYEKCNDILNVDNLNSIFYKHKPVAVINCIGIIKQVESANNIDYLYKVNSLFPKILADIAQKHSVKIINFSTDCVFDGVKGNYSDDEIGSATDSYGISKYLGEVQSESVLNIRTSIIGHGLKKNASLVDWFLSQEGSVNGYTKAIFSGLPVNYIGGIISDKIDILLDIHGTFNLSAKPISKYDLLCTIKEVYGINSINIVPYDGLVIDRSLNSEKLRKIINLHVPDWNNLILDMFKFYGYDHVQK